MSNQPLWLVQAPGSATDGSRVARRNPPCDAERRRLQRRRRELRSPSSRPTNRSRPDLVLVSRPTFARRFSPISAPRLAPPRPASQRSFASCRRPGGAIRARVAIRGQACRRPLCSARFDLRRRHDPDSRDVARRASRSLRGTPRTRPIDQLGWLALPATESPRCEVEKRHGSSPDPWRLLLCAASLVTLTTGGAGGSEGRAAPKDPPATATHRTPSLASHSGGVEDVVIPVGRRPALRAAEPTACVRGWAKGPKQKVLPGPDHGPGRDAACAPKP